MADRRYSFWSMPVAFASSALPILALAALLDPFAGRETIVSWNMSIAVTVAGLPALVYWRRTRRKLHEQSRELERIRGEVQRREGRIAQLEQVLHEHKIDLPSLIEENQ